LVGTLGRVVNYRAIPSGLRGNWRHGLKAWQKAGPYLLLTMAWVTDTPKCCRPETWYARVITCQVL